MLLRGCRISVFSPLPKNENSKIRKILQKRHNTLILECSFKTSTNIIQIISKSKWLYHITDHIAGICLLRGFGFSIFIKLSPFLLISIVTLKN